MGINVVMDGVSGAMVGLLLPYRSSARFTRVCGFDLGLFKYAVLFSR